MKFLYHHRTRSRDGQSVHIDEMIAALRECGHTVEVVGPERVDALKTASSKRLLPKFLYELLEFGYSALEFIRLSRAVLRSRPDALYERANIYMLSGVWTARLFSLPLLLEVNAPLAEERGRNDGLALPRLARWSEEVAWRGANRVLPVTKVLAGYLERAGVPSSHIVVTSNGVDLRRFPAGGGRSCAATQLETQSGPVLGFVGFIRDWHGLPQIVDLMASDDALKSARLLVVGDGPGRATLEQRARELGVEHRVHVTGVAERSDLASYIRAFDIALQPEVTAYASPLKLFEYMALGRAIVAPDAPNIREILEDHKDALLFEPGSRKSLAEAVSELVSDAELRQRLGAAAAAKIVEHGITWRRNAERAIALVREIRREAEGTRSR
jgi:glycosyltransferase involved in cell wall biosynthesis